MPTTLGTNDEIAALLGWSSETAPPTFETYLDGCDAMIVLTYGEHPAADATGMDAKERNVRLMVLAQLLDLAMRAVGVQTMQGTGIRLEFTPEFQKRQFEVLSQLRSWIER